MGFAVATGMLSIAALAKPPYAKESGFDGHCYLMAAFVNQLPDVGKDDAVLLIVLNYLHQSAMFSSERISD